MVYFKENYNFPRLQRGSTFFQGGPGGDPTFSRGSICFFNKESHITCVFSGLAGLLAYHPPLDRHMQYLDQLDAVTKVRYEKRLSILTALGIPVCIHGVWENNHSGLPGLTRIQIVFHFRTLRVLITLGQIHCILPLALKLYLTCHLLITFATQIGPDILIGLQTV